MNQTRALLIRRYRLSESSLILVWLTQEYGKIKTTAQGAMKRESSFAGCLELFSELEIGFVFNKKNELHVLKEVISHLPQEKIKPGYPTLLTASYFAELCDLLIEPSHPVPELFNLLQRAFQFLSKKNPTSLAVHHFEKELAKGLGIYNEALSAESSLLAAVRELPQSRKKLFEELAFRN